MFEPRFFVVTRPSLYKSVFATWFFSSGQIVEKVNVFAGNVYKLNQIWNILFRYVWWSRLYNFPRRNSSLVHIKYIICVHIQKFHAKIMKPIEFQYSGSLQLVKLIWFDIGRYTYPQHYIPCNRAAFSLCPVPSLIQ